MATLRSGVLYKIPSTGSDDVIALVGTVYEQFLYIGTKERLKKKREELQAKNHLAVFVRKVK